MENQVPFRICWLREFRRRTMLWRETAALPRWPRPSLPSHCCLLSALHMHVCGHPASQPSSTVMPCTQMSSAVPSGPSGLRCTPSSTGCPENRPRAEARWAGSKQTFWAEASRVTDMGTAVLKVVNRFFSLALLIPRPTGRAVAREVPS